MFEKIKKVIESLLVSQDGNKTTPISINKINLEEKEFDNESTEEGGNLSTKVWTKEFYPLRQLVLWGWDEDQNPGFLILYGRHKFQNTKAGNVLEEDVQYTSYAIFKGREGHLPSFEAVKIIESGFGKPTAMYYKKGIRKYWIPDKNCSVEEFKNFKSRQRVVFSYFHPKSHEQYVREIKDKRIDIAGFSLANTPKEILKLDEQFKEYEELLIEILSNPSLYMRKKKLDTLLSKNPPKQVLITLFNIGSTELISGLFLELAKRNNPIFVEIAKQIVESEVKWAAKSYGKGIKRCAKIYMNGFDNDLKEERIRWIRKRLNKMDLPLIGINGKEFSKDKVIAGSQYRKYALGGLLTDTYYRYDYNTRKSIEYRAPKRYEQGPYTDGVSINLIKFKNTIQESEIYQLGDVLGKIAYFLDAPRLTYYLKGNSQTKALKYFQRYVRRIIDSYAENNPDKFMEAMKVLLTSYTENDFVCKFPGNFQFNELLKHYLYYDFTQKPPSSSYHWRERYEWMTNDNLLRLEGRYEFMKEIWDDHLDIVAEIAIEAKINQVVKACYYILKDSPNTNEFIECITYKQLIGLSFVQYEPMAKMFTNVLMDKISQTNIFESELMLTLMGCPHKKMHELAMAYFKRTNGKFSPEVIADLMMIEHIEQWTELFEQNLLSLQEEEYVKFIEYVIERVTVFWKHSRKLPEDITNILTQSTNQLQTVSKTKKAELINKLFELLLTIPKIPKWMGIFIEELIFSLSYEELETLLTDIIPKPNETLISSSNKRIITVLDSIKNKQIPSDSQIRSILDFGTSKMVKILFDVMTNNSEVLEDRFSVLLMMFESEIIVLNKKAEEVFDTMPKEKQKKMHLMLIDSPVERAYVLGLHKLDAIYQGFIPQQFIIQMLEHGSSDVKAYISNKIEGIIEHLGYGNKALFMYYLKTLLLSPNKNTAAKDRICEVIPKFALMFRDELDEIQSILLDIGGSNVIIDSERALVTLAKIRGEVIKIES